MTWHPLWVIAYLTGLIASGHISTNMYAPSLPAMAAYFDASAASVQATVSVFLIAFAFGQLLYGPLSDRYGRRTVLIGGLIVYAVTTLGSVVLATLFPSIEVLILCRALQALGACAGPVMGRAITRDLYSREETARVMAYVAMAMGLAPAFAPVLGGHLEEWFDWRASFLVTLGFVLVVLVATLAALKETNTYRGVNTQESVVGMVGGFAELVRSRDFMAFVLVGSLVYGGMFTFQTAGPFVIVDLLGYTAADYGWFSAAPILAYMVGSFIAGRLTHSTGVDAMVPIGMLAVVFGAAVFLTLALTMPASALNVFGPLTVMSVGMSIMFPGTMAGAVSIKPRIAGTASALYGFLQMGAAAVAISVLGLFESRSHLPFAWVCSLAMFAAGAVSFWQWRWSRSAPSSAQ
ncbi:MAG: multidrug effflux MFS transporter [Alphaproteobacteria bacterium]|nr:multidrug effflux MFS transporter [Alphaproteobacteria bacterium]